MFLRLRKSWLCHVNRKINCTFTWLPTRFILGKNLHINCWTIKPRLQCLRRLADSWFFFSYFFPSKFGLGFSFALSFGQVNLVSYMRTRVLIENFDKQKFRVSASSSVVQTKELLLIVSNIKRCLKILQIHNLMFPGSQRDKASTCSVGSVGSTEYRCYRPHTSLRKVMFPVMFVCYFVCLQG